MENSETKQRRLGCNVGRGVDNWDCYTDCAFWDRKKCTRYEIGRKEVMEVGSLKKEQYRTLWLGLVEKTCAQQQENEQLQAYAARMREALRRGVELINSEMMQYDAVLRQARQILSGVNVARCPYCWGKDTHHENCDIKIVIDAIDDLLGGKEE